MEDEEWWWEKRSSESEDVRFSRWVVWEDKLPTELLPLVVLPPPEATLVGKELAVLEPEKDYQYVLAGGKEVKLRSATTSCIKTIFQESEIFQKTKKSQGNADVWTKENMH